MHKKSLLAVLAAAVVFAACWWWFAGGATLPMPAPPSGTGAAATSTTPVSAEAGRASPAERPTASQAAALERTEVPAVAGAPVASTYTVRGRIVDAQGAPRPAIELTTSTWPTDPGSTVADGEDPQTKSDEGGRFALVVPIGRDGHLHVRGSELEWADATPAFHSAAGEQDLGDLVVVRSAVLQGVVQDENGRPVADVRIEAGRGTVFMDTRSSTSSAADGTFTIGKLGAGTWTVRTASAAYLPTKLEVLLAAEERRTDLVVVVKQGNAIAGQVVDDRGVGVAGCKVACKRRELDGSMDIERFRSDEAATTDAGGYFTLAGLPPGTVTIRAFGKGHTTVMANDVAVGTGDLVLTVQRFAVITGVLSTADGAPIADSRIEVERGGWTGRVDPADDVAFAGGRNVTTAADGSFRLERVVPGVVSLRASGHAHLPATVTGIQVVPGQELTGVRVVADAGATARVLVVDHAGEPVAGAEVRAQNPSTQSGAMRYLHRDGATDLGPDPTGFAPWSERGTATTGRDGTALVVGLPATSLRFTATHESFGDSLPVEATATRGATTDVRLVLRRPGFLDVVVVDAAGAVLPGAKLRVEPETGERRLPWHASSAGTRDATCGSDGTARVGPLSPGEYRVALKKLPPPSVGHDAEMFVFGADDTIGCSAQKVVVGEGSTVRIEVRKPVLTRLVGTLVATEGPLAGGDVELQSGGDEVPVPGFGEVRTTTGSDGSFAIDDVEPGTYTVSFGRRNQVVKGQRVFEVPPGTPELRLDLALHTGRVTVQVHAAASGEPIEGADVELERDGGEAAPAPPRMAMIARLSSDGDEGESMTMTVGAQRVRSDAHGDAVVEDVPVGTYRVRASRRGFVSAERGQLVVVERQTTDCGRLDLRGAGRVRVTVVRGDGGRVDVAAVQHRAVGTEKWSDPQFAAGGAVDLDGLSAGRYALRATRPGGPGVGPETEVEVTTGATVTTELRAP